MRAKKEISPYAFPGIQIDKDQIITIWENVYGLTLDQVNIRDKHYTYSIPRQVLMFALVEFGGLSYANAGAVVGRDHSTAMHAKKKVLETHSQDKRVNKPIEELVKELSIMKGQLQSHITVKLHRSDFLKLMTDLTEEQQKWPLNALWIHYQQNYKNT